VVPELRGIRKNKKNSGPGPESNKKGGKRVFGGLGEKKGGGGVTSNPGVEKVMRTGTPD